MSNPRKAFTLVETLLVVLIVALLAGVALVKLGHVYTEGIASRARIDIDLLNKAIRDRRADNPAEAFAPANASDAFLLARPYMSLPANIPDLASFNASTQSRWAYVYLQVYPSNKLLGTDSACAALVKRGQATSENNNFCLLTPMTNALVSGSNQAFLFYAIAVQ